MRRLLPGCVLPLIAGCTVGANFVPPSPATANSWRDPARDVPSVISESPLDDAWWTCFGDPVLTSLISRLTRQNLDLATAGERVAQARAERAVIASQGLPHVDARASYTRERESKNGLVALTQPAPGAPLEFNLWDDSLSASWELDLFGKVRRAVESADATTVSLIEARRGIALAGIADLAQFYLQLRGVQAREAVTRRYMEVAERRRQLVRERWANDVATMLDVSQAGAQASTIAAELPPLLAMQAKLINAMGLLLGEPPGAVDAELRAERPQPLAPPTVPIGIPPELLRRRPDIREAEARLHAATAQTGVAVAAFYPDIQLNGGLGSESLHAGTLFDWASRMFTIGPTIDLPIFEGGRLRGTLQLREAAQREAAIAFQKAVIQACHDVDNALEAYADAQRRQSAVVAAERDDGAVLRLAEQRYREGVADFLDVTSAQAAVLQAQNALVEAQTDVVTNLVGLYKALGGGWQAAEGPTS